MSNDLCNTVIAAEKPFAFFLDGGTILAPDLQEHMRRKVESVLADHLSHDFALVDGQGRLVEHSVEDGFTDQCPSIAHAVREKVELEDTDAQGIIRFILDETMSVWTRTVGAYSARR